MAWRPAPQATSRARGLAGKRVEKLSTDNRNGSGWLSVWLPDRNRSSHPCRSWPDMIRLFPVSEEGRAGREPFHQTSHRLAAMAALCLLFQRQLGKRLSSDGIKEQRVVAESPVSPRLSENEALRDAAESR